MRGAEGGVRLAGMKADRHDRCKRQLHLWLRCDTYVKLQNLAKEQGESVTNLLTRMVEKETADVAISQHQAREIKKRIEGRPLLEMAERVADEITEAVVRFPGVRMYHK